MAACDDKFHEECGVFAIYDRNRPAALETYYGIFSLQHRGQESAGITVSDGHTMETFRGMGLVTEVFRKLPEKGGLIGIGHVRYSTTGSSIPSNIQPLQLEGAEGPLALAHNGNLVNTKVLRNRLLQSGSTFQTTMDTEIIIKLLAHAGAAVMEDRIKGVMDEIRGAYAVVACTNRAVYGFRDPFGYRPMALGKTESGYVLCSETPALDAIDAEFVRDILPGEIVRIDDDGVHSTMYGKKAPRLGICAFEYIYFARSDSFIDGVSVYEARKQAGRILARKYPVEADMVVGVPESGIDAAIGYSEESRIPYEKAIVKNSYIGRTFIKPSQKERMKSVKIKLNPIADKIKGKRVVIIDDSIVRGTTVDRIVTMLKEAGAKEVHMRISSPPFMWPCYYGTDIPSRGELIACNHTIEEITKLSKADSLGYLPVESLREMIHNAPVGFCDGCFTGNYLAPITKETFKGKERGGMNFDENNKKDN